MSKITEYTSVNTFDSGDVLLKDGSNGTKIIPVESAASEFLRLGGQNTKNAEIETALTNFGSNLAGLEAEYVATNDYAVGDFFMVENKLYKATTAIADGDTIVPDTNCVETDISTEFKATKEIVDGLPEEIVKKANTDGYYTNLAAGTADQLMASQKVHNSDPYIFRTSGGTSDIGNREELEIVGGSVAWNQLVQNGNFVDGTDKWTMTSATASVDNNIATINTTTLGGITQNISPKIDHVILASAVIQNVDASTAMIRLNNSIDKLIDASITGWQTVSNVVKYNSVNSGTIYIRIVNNTDNSQSLRVKSINAFDLTAMFGSEIADHIYELEQATAGAGVAWFRKYFPNDYYDYNPGELMHVSDLQSHDTVGFNLWDEEWEAGEINTNTGADSQSSTRIRSKNYIPIYPNTKYYAKAPSTMYLFFYDKNKDYIGYHGSTVSNKTFVPAALYNSKSGGGSFADACYMRFGCDNATTYNNDVCINLSWSGTRNGEYEPYIKHSYPLDPSLTLRGIPKLTADGDLTYDGDVYESDGTVERRYGIVDLGTLTGWSSNLTGQNAIEVAVSLPEKAFGRTNIFCDKLVVGAGTAIDTAVLSVCGFLNSRGIAVKVPKTLATTIQEAVDWIQSNHPILVYELAERTTEEAEPYTSPQIVYDWGTEEFVTTSIVPVGHNTSYPANLRDKLQHLPDLPDDDGYYITQVTGAQMSLIRFRIPQAPAEDGTYVLKATVTDGVPVYTWIDPDAAPETEEPAEP